MNIKKHFYTNGIKTIKLSDDDPIPEGFYKGRTFKVNPWNKGLTMLYIHIEMIDILLIVIFIFLQRICLLSIKVPGYMVNIHLIKIM